MKAIQSKPFCKGKVFWKRHLLDEDLNVSKDVVRQNERSAKFVLTDVGYGRNLRIVTEVTTENAVNEYQRSCFKSDVSLAAWQQTSGKALDHKNVSNSMRRSRYC